MQANANINVSRCIQDNYVNLKINCVTFEATEPFTFAVMYKPNK
jgi:hypothetical protein